MAITRDQAAALIQEQLINTIFQDVPKQSAVLGLMRKLPNMTSKQTKIPVLDMLPLAYWVNGDNGFKKTTQQAWDNVYLTAAELAVIVPIPEAVLSDSSYDIMGEVTPRVNEAMGQRIDQAIVFGMDDIYAAYETSVEKIKNPDDSIDAGISVEIQGELYVAKSFESTESAMINLQNKLPQNVKIICCQSCIHGNFCPVGNFDDEIFCTSDFEPKMAEDIFRATENDEERRKRSRNLLYVCGRYEKITDDKYSYNDWKYMIKG